MNGYAKDMQKFWQLKKELTPNTFSLQQKQNENGHAMAFHQLVQKLGCLV